MLMIILIAFFSLIVLMVLHEFGHFILAKKFGVKVEEFGIGYPPRLFGKKIGETIYSINLLPFGAFVRIYGQEEEADNPWSFGKKPFWQKALIILGGVISFWIVAVILLSVVMAIGAPTAITDEEGGNLINPKVQIIAVSSKSPAEDAGLKIGDNIKKLSIINYQFSINKVNEFQKLVDEYKGQEIALTIQRGEEILDVSLIPRADPPQGEGPLGIALARTALISYPWYLAPIKGVEATGNLTLTIIEGWKTALERVVKKEPTGVQLMGPVGIMGLFSQVGQLGANYFLQFIAIISVYMALFNLLPIPAVDGGQLLFLVIEKIRGKPLNQKVVQKINATFFTLLVILSIWVTIKDIQRIF